MNIEYTKVGDYLLPNLVIDNRNLEEQQIFSLEGAAYGIAYHGE